MDNAQKFHWYTDADKVCYNPGDDDAASAEDAKSIVDQHNVDVEAAYAAGLEAGRDTICKTILEGHFLSEDSLEKKFANQVVAMIKRIQWDNPRQAMAAVAPSVKPTTPAPAEPAPLVLTDAEKAFWGQVYAAVVAARTAHFLSTGNPSFICPKEEADAAIAAIRARSAPGEVARLKPQNDGPLDHCITIDKNAKQVQFELNQAQTRIAELETQLAAARQGAETNRAEGAKAERERCAGEIRRLIEASKAKRPPGPTTLEHGINVGQQDALKTALDCILNPTT